jgi:hypothetical protein
MVNAPGHDKRGDADIFTRAQAGIQCHVWRRAIQSQADDPVIGSPRRQSLLAMTLRRPVQRT